MSNPNDRNEEPEEHLLFHRYISEQLGRLFGNKKTPPTMKNLENEKQAQIEREKALEEELAKYNDLQKRKK